MIRRTDKRYHSTAWRRLTGEIQRRDVYTCHWCGGPSSLIDHVIRSDEAPERFFDPSNLVAACRSCNQGRRQNGDAWKARHQAESPRILVTATHGRPSTASSEFIEWSLTLPLVGGEPTGHGHGGR